MEEPVFIYGEIGVAFTQDDFKNVGANGDPVVIHISSEGGSVFQGFTIYNRILELRRKGIKVIARIEGLCASIATLIALAADEVEMSETAQWMIHNPFNNVIGDADELARESQRLRAIEGQLIKVYMEKTGKSEEEIKALMKEEAMITATEAKEIGFVDKVIEPVKAVAKLDSKMANELNEKFEEARQKMEKAFDERLKAIEKALNPKAEVELSLADGGSVYVDSEDGEIEGKSVYTDESMTEPAPDGVHALEDGRQITVSGGQITSVSEVAEESKKQEAELEAERQAKEEAQAYVKVLVEKLEAQEKVINEVRGELGELAKIKNMFAGKGEDTKQPKKEITDSPKEERFTIQDLKRGYK